MFVTMRLSARLGPAQPDQVLHRFQPPAQFVTIAPVIGVADLNEQVGVRRLQQFRQYGKLFTRQVESLMSDSVHDDTLSSERTLRFHLTLETRAVNRLLRAAHQRRPASRGARI
jgi:hypothetical protein